ncbi:MAG: hypothetical protein KF891_20465 [Rhizobacter sp.]|nr:hypothetical protein [Rhizobacter sp.]
MKLRIVPARQGIEWARQGLRVFFMRPLSFMGLFGVVLLAMLLAQLLSWAGSLLLWASLPLITLAFMLATQQVLQGRVPTFRVFVEPLRGDRARARSLWLLGGLYALSMLLIVAVHAWIDGGRIAALQEAATSGQATPESMAPLLADGRLQLSLLWFAVSAGLLSMPFWHAPALVHWGGQTAGKALFFSTVACWRNKGAFALYALTGLGAVMAFAIVSSLVFALLGAPNLAAMVMMPAVLFFTVVFYASLYFTFADCFEPNTPSAPAILETSA